MKEPSKAAVTAAWITGLLGCVGVTIAAIIGLGLPVVQRLVEPTPTPMVIVVTATAPQPTADVITPDTPMPTSVAPTNTPTRKPTNAPTLKPPTNTPTSRPTATRPPTNTPRPEPTDTPMPPTPVPTVPPNTQPGTILEMGETWYQDGVSMKVVRGVIDPDWYYGDIYFEFEVTNGTGHEILLTYDTENLSLVDNLGQQWELKGFSNHSWWCKGPFVIPLAPGQTHSTRNICKDGGYRLYFKGDIANPSVTELIITADGISSISNARWRFRIAR